MVPLTPDVYGAPLSAIGYTLRAVAFWTAVALPVSIIVVLATGGDVRLAGLLLLCNAGALILGHGHRSQHAYPNREP